MKSVVLWIKIVFITIIYSLRFLKTEDKNVLRKWTLSVLKTSNVRVVCKGEFPKRPFMIMANHESYFDILAILYCCDFELMWFAKKELFKIPVIGRVLEKNNTIAVDRDNPLKSSFSVLKALKTKGENKALVIFPQGTRKTKDSFKEGGFLIASKKNIPIVPVKITGSDYILPKGSKTIRSGTIAVEIFDKIDAKDGSAKEKVKERIL